MKRIIARSRFLDSTTNYFVGVVYRDIPHVNPDITDGSTERGVNSSVEMTGADSLLWVIGSIVEIPIRLPLT